MSEERKLLPCPFCDSKVNITYCGTGTYEIYSDNKSCMICGGGILITHGGFVTTDINEVIKAWNTRHTTEPKKEGLDWEKDFDQEFSYEGEGHWKHWLDSYDEDDNFVGKVKGWAVPDAFKQFIKNRFAPSGLSNKCLHADVGYPICPNCNKTFTSYSLMPLNIESVMKTMAEFNKEKDFEIYRLQAENLVATFGGAREGKDKKVSILTLIKIIREGLYRNYISIKKSKLNV